MSAAAVLALTVNATAGTSDRHGRGDEPAPLDHIFVIMLENHSQSSVIGDSNAPFINHTDQELMLIEALVGRVPPFVFPKSDYNPPRRSY